MLKVRLKKNSNISDCKMINQLLTALFLVFPIIENFSHGVFKKHTIIIWFFSTIAMSLYFVLKKQIAFKRNPENIMFLCIMIVFSLGVFKSIILGNNYFSLSLYFYVVYFLALGLLFSGCFEFGESKSYINNLFEKNLGNIGYLIFFISAASLMIATIEFIYKISIFNSSYLYISILQIFPLAILSHKENCDLDKISLLTLIFFIFISLLVHSRATLITILFPLLVSLPFLFQKIKKYKVLILLTILIFCSFLLLFVKSGELFNRLILVNFTDILKLFFAIDQYLFNGQFLNYNNSIEFIDEIGARNTDIDRVIHLNASVQQIMLNYRDLFFGKGFYAFDYELGEIIKSYYDMHLPYLNFERELGAEQNIASFGLSKLLYENGFLSLYIFCSYLVIIIRFTFLKYNPNFSLIISSVILIIVARLYGNNYLLDLMFWAAIAPNGIIFTFINGINNRTSKKE